MDDAVYVYERDDSHIIGGAHEVNYDLFAGESRSIHVTSVRSLDALAEVLVEKAKSLAGGQGLTLYRTSAKSHARFEYNGDKITRVIGATSDTDELLAFQKSFVEKLGRIRSER